MAPVIGAWDLAADSTVLLRQSLFCAPVSVQGGTTGILSGEGRVHVCRGHYFILSHRLCQEVLLYSLWGVVAREGPWHGQGHLAVKIEWTDSLLEGQPSATQDSAGGWWTHGGFALLYWVTHLGTTIPGQPTPSSDTNKAPGSRYALEEWS